MQALWEYHLLDLAGDLPHPAAQPVFSRQVTNPILRNAYRYCDQITAEHSKSFYLASSLLPIGKRLPVRALYAFCRTVDDIVDESQGDDRLDRLSYWKTVVLSGTPGSNDPVAEAWVDTFSRFSIPRHIALQLIDGVARDLTTRRYPSFSELTTYCYGVASTVGLMSMYIIGFQSTSAMPYAIKLGVALQMTNILRDVGEDFRRGFLYLPQDELARFHITESDIAAGIVTPAWRQFMRFQIQRTRVLFQDAQPGIAMLTGDGHLSIAAAANFYSGILDDIEANDYDVFTHRANLSAWAKIKRIPGLWWSASRLA